MGHDSTSDMRQFICGDKAADRTIVIAGDSHAAMWLAAINPAANRTGWKVILLEMQNCHMPILHFWHNETNTPYKDCDIWRQWALDEINKVKPQIAILTSAYFNPLDFDHKPISNQEWAQGTAAALQQISTIPQRFVFGDIPYLEQSTPECLAAHQDDVTACSAPVSTAVNSEHIRTEAAATAAAGAVYVDPTPWLCSSICTPVIGNMIVYTNRFQISRTYAAWLSGVVQEELHLH
jgi:hypothetical protein